MRMHRCVECHDVFICDILAMVDIGRQSQVEKTEWPACRHDRPPKTGRQWVPDEGSPYRCDDCESWMAYGK